MLNGAVLVFLPANGTYTVLVEGLHLGPYNLAMKSLDVNGKPQTFVKIPGIANVGSTATYQVQFNATPGAHSTVTSMTTFASALADVSNGFKAGLITKQPVEQALTDLLILARDASYRNDRLDHDIERAALGVFKAVVSAETNKQITGTEPQVLQNDASYLISQIPSD